MERDDHLFRFIQEKVDELKQFYVDERSRNDNSAGTRYLTRKQAAKYLSISPATLDQWARTGRLRKLNKGGGVRFDKLEIDSRMQDGSLSKYRGI